MWDVIWKGSYCPPEGKSKPTNTSKEGGQCGSVWVDGIGWGVGRTDAVVGLEEGSVGRKVGPRARVGLYIHSPFRRAQMKSFQGTLNAKSLDLVDDFSAPIVALPGQPFRVLVRQTGRQCLHYSLRGKILSTRSS